MTNLLMCFKQIEKAYQIGARQISVLRGVSLDVRAGELIAIVGASGSGKSTLMNIMGLLDKADDGDYLFQGRCVTQLSEDERAGVRNQDIGFVFQQFNLLPRFSAAQNVALPLTYRQLPESEVKQRVERALARVGLLAFATHRPAQLSGGQQQRVAIARALVGEPQVILADEPTGALDSVTGSEIMRLFLALHQEGKTLILVTHDERIASQCSRKIVLVDGQIVADSTS